MPLGFSTPVASASTPSNVPVTVAWSAPGIGETVSLMDADVLPQAGQAVPADDASDEATSKRQRIFCIINGNELAHEDDHNPTTFSETELDNLEAYDYDSDMDDEYYTNIDTSNQDSMLQSLTFHLQIKSLTFLVWSLQPLTR